MSSNGPAIQAYPLQWPIGWPRTPAHKRERARFKVGMATARDHLLAELRRLGAGRVVISSTVRTRNDGLPYASGAWRAGEDPGVCVYFTVGRKDKAIPCDTYTTPEANIRALGLAIEAMRALDRHGISGLLDRAMVGLDALPPPDAIDWRKELGFAPGERPDPMTLATRYREMARRLHPDAGGNLAAMIRLNRARDEAIKEIHGP